MNTNGNSARGWIYQHMKQQMTAKDKKSSMKEIEKRLVHRGGMLRATNDKYTVA